jgi:hypothetical protein
MHAQYVFVAHKSTGTAAPGNNFFSLCKFDFFVMFTALCRIFVIGRIFGSIFLPNIRFRPKQENPFSVDHYRTHIAKKTLSSQNRLRRKTPPSHELFQHLLKASSSSMHLTLKMSSEIRWFAYWKFDKKSPAKAVIEKKQLSFKLLLYCTKHLCMHRFLEDQRPPQNITALYLFLNLPILRTRSSNNRAAKHLFSISTNYRNRVHFGTDFAKTEGEVFS